MNNKKLDIKYGAHEDNLLDLYLPERNEFNILVYFHGGGLTSGDKREDYIVKIIEYLVRNNIAVASVNYRMYPKAKYPQFINDAAAAVSWIKTNINKYGKCNKLYVGGSSAGAYLSQMLCFNPEYLKKYNLQPDAVDGYIHDAGQPTSHFNVLKEKGVDSRRIIVDETAPLYYIGTSPKYQPMIILVSDNDIENRYEQTMLVYSTLKHFGYDCTEILLRVMHGKHVSHDFEFDNEGDSVFGKIINNFIMHRYDKIIKE